MSDLSFHIQEPLTSNTFNLLPPVQNVNYHQNNDQLSSLNHSLIRRQLLLESIPSNSCSYTSTLDIVQGSPFLSNLNILLQHDPDLLPSLRRRPPQNARYSKAILRMQAKFQSDYNLTLRQQQDPWILLTCLRHFLQKFSQVLTVPMCQAICQKCSINQTYAGDLEYQKDHRHKVRLKPILCAQCGHDMVMSPGFLPQVFFVRVRNLRAGYFDDFDLPKFSGYKKAGIVQYNRSTKHFRTAKFFGSKTLILDGPTINWTQNRQSIQDDGSWDNYILEYRRVAKDIPKNPDIPYTFYGSPERIITGGMINCKSTKPDKPGIQNQPLQQNLGNDDMQCSARQNNLYQTPPRKDQSPIMKKVSEFTQRIRKACKNAYKTNIRDDSVFTSELNNILQPIFEEEHNHLRAVQEQLETQKNLLAKLQKEQLKTKIKNEQLESHLFTMIETTYQCLPQLKTTEILPPSNLQTPLDEGQTQEKPTQMKKDNNQFYSKIDQNPKERRKILESYPPQYKPLYRNIQKLSNNVSSSVQIKNKHPSIQPKQQQMDDWFTFSKEQLQKKHESYSNIKPSGIRSSMLKEIPPNSCACLTALDFLSKSTWLQYAPPTNHNKNLVDFLTGRPESSFGNALLDIHSYCKDKRIQINDIGTQQDPWLYLNIIQKMLIDETQMQDEPILPICQCSCGLPNRKIYQGNINLVRYPNSNIYELSRLRCDACNNSQKTIYSYLPPSFAVRFDDHKFKGIFTATNSFWVDGYFQQSIIQYNRKKRHFRCLKIIGASKLEIYDGLSLSTITNSQQRKCQIENFQWENYIASYKRNNKNASSPANVSYPIPKMASVFNRILTGGSDDPDPTIKIGHWNIRSQKKWRQKSGIMTEAKPLIMSIQQPRGSKTLKQYTVYDAFPSSTKANPGNGNSLKLNAQVACHSSVKSQQIFKDENSVGVVCSGPPLKCQILVISLYVHCNSTLEEKISQFDNIIAQIDTYMVVHQETQILIMGDFNMSIQQLRQLIGRSPFIDFILSINHFDFGDTCKARPSSRGTKIDHVFYTGEGKNAKTIVQPGSDLSDHALMIMEIEAKEAPVCTSSLPNKQFQKQLTSTLKRDATITNLLDAIDLTKMSGIPLKLQRTSKQIIQSQINYHKIAEFRQKGWNDKYLQTFNQKIDRIVDSSSKSQLFKQIKKLTHYDTFDKKDGSIMNKAIHEGNIIVGEQFHDQLISHFNRIHSSSDPPDKINEFPFQTMGDSKIFEAARRVKRKKATSWDCVNSFIFQLHKECRSVSRRCLECQQKMSILKNLCTKQYWNDPRSSIHLASRIIPLNKVHPKTPEISEYRPIIIVSYVFKFLEQLIMPQLLDYQRKLDRRQFGFTRGVSIAECKRMLYKKCCELQNKNFRNQKDRPKLLFFDVKSAYDSTNLKLLYQKIQEKEILSPGPYRLLRFIHSNIKIQFNNSSCGISRGVPQGLATSPSLFSIFINDTLTQLGESNFCLFYADDIVCAVDNDYEMRICIRKTREALEKVDLKINNKKSAIMRICKKFSQQKGHTEILQIPLVDRYKYLGCWIFNNLDPRRHFSQINKNINFVSAKLSKIRSKGDIKTNINLFKVLIMPRIRMFFSFYDLLSIKQQIDIQKQVRIHFKHFCCLPKSTSNLVVTELIGDLDQIMKNDSLLCELKLKAFIRKETFIHGNKLILKMNTSIKKIPRNLSTLLRLLYGKKCKDHNTFLNSYHLTHHHGLVIDPIMLIRRIKHCTSVRMISKEIHRLNRKLDAIKL